MNPQVFGAIMSVVAIVVIPLGVALFRGAIKWTRVETKLDELVKDVKDMAIAKEATHLLILQTVKDDRAATDRRLRWLEETLWKRGRPNGNGS